MQNREKICPRCGKKVAVSSEELSLHDGVVVCPQCLAVFDDNGVRQAPQPGRVRVASPQPQEPVSDEIHYCHHCGKPLVSDANFCPYCGKRVRGADPAPAEERQEERVEENLPAPQPQQPDAIADDAPTAQEPAVKWTPVYTNYRYREPKWGEGPASIRARLAGYAVIAAQLALLAFIVYKAMLISD